MPSQQDSDYLEKGATTVPATPVIDCIPFLREQLAVIYQSGQKIRPWFLWELHNPWSRAASNVDSWKFLDLCQSAELAQLVTPFIGEDIILFDSQFSPDLHEAGKSETSWRNDRLRCPVHPLHGLVVRIPFSDLIHENVKFIYRTGRSREQVIQVKTGRIICHNINLAHRIDGIDNLVRPIEYVIRYFPATSRYQRDPSSKLHRELMEQYPLINYAQIPLWLVQGEDKADNDFVTGFQPKPGRWIMNDNPDINSTGTVQ